MKSKPSSPSGFSLLELLIVIAIIAIVAAIAIPWLFYAKHTARGATAVAALRLIHSSQVTYKSSNGVYGNLTQLSNAGYVSDSALASGQKLDYSYTVTPDIAQPANGYTAIATPISRPTIRLHFFVNATGVIREHLGSAASVSDPPID